MYQIMLVLGAFMLLSFLTVSVNRAVIDKTVGTYQSESIIAASTLAQALLQEVCLRDFDEKSLVTAVDSATKMTAAGSLGTESETYPLFDDLDDYKYYSRLDTIVNGIYRSSVNVNYVTLGAPNDSTNGSTFYKRVSVTVASTDATSGTYPIKLTTVVAY